MKLEAAGYWTRPWAKIPSPTKKSSKKRGPALFSPLSFAPTTHASSQSTVMAIASTSTAAADINQHIDAGLLLSVDSSALPSKLSELSPSAREAVLLARATASTQALVSALWALPSTTHPDHGRIALLPSFLPVGSGGTPVPREKALPAPKAETKWEAFAKRKGIAVEKKKDRLVWDDERKEWVPRWGYNGKNKDAEQQWIHVLKSHQGE